MQCSIVIPVSACTRDPRIPGAESVVLTSSTYPIAQVTAKTQAAVDRFMEQVRADFSFLPVDTDAREFHGDSQDSMCEDIAFCGRETILESMRGRVLDMANSFFGAANVLPRDVGEKIHFVCIPQSFSDTFQYVGGGKYQSLLRIHAPVIK
jgi:hypothetical protein